MPAGEPVPPGRAAYGWLLVVTTAVVTLAAVVVPWDWPLGDLSGSVDPRAGLSAETLDRIADYRSKAVPLGLLARAISVSIAVLLAVTPWGARLVRTLPGRRRWPVQLALASLALVVIGRVVAMPATVPLEVARREAGLSTRSWPEWVLDVARGVLVDSVATVLALGLLIGLARWGRRGWWLLASALAGLLVAAGAYLYPLLVEPVFNSFEPLPDGPLRTSLVRLAAQDGIPIDEVLRVDASRRTTAVNAYVSGLGSTRRLVVYDTLLQDATAAEVRLVVAHELGHTAEHDVATGTALGALGATAGVTVAVLIASAGPVRRRAGVAGLHTVEAAPLMLGLVAVGVLAVLPVQNLVSRAFEARADVHALDLTGDSATFEVMQRRFATTNLNDPDPPRWLYVWFASHPSPAERIALAQRWALAR
ncbi:M48 family metallopeptidase [soil metagenome]